MLEEDSHSSYVNQTEEPTIDNNKCKYCMERAVIDDDGYFYKHETEIELATGLLAALYIGTDEYGRIVMRARGDDDSEDYYPKFCPECGRKLISTQGKRYDG